MPEHPINPASLVNISRYPVDSTENPQHQKSLTLTRAQLKRDGCAVIPDFLSPFGLSRLLAEAEERRKFAYFSANTKTNVYFSDDDPSLAQDHPKRIFSIALTASSRAIVLVITVPAECCITGPP